MKLVDLAGSRVCMAWLFCCASSSTIAGAVAQSVAALPDLGAPPRSKVQWIAQAMRLNGLPMKLQLLRSPEAPDDVFDHYESQWRGRAHHELRRSTQGEWQTLSIKSPTHYITLQLTRTSSGSEGTITVSAPPVSARPATNFPRPVSSRLLSVQEYDDAGIESEHISLSSARSVNVEAQAFQHELARAGWRSDMQASFQGKVIEAQKGAQHAFVTLQPDSLQPAGTAIVIIWRKS